MEDYFKNFFTEYITLEIINETIQKWNYILFIEKYPVHLWIQKLIKYLIFFINTHLDKINAFNPNSPFEKKFSFSKSSLPSYHIIKKRYTLLFQSLFWYVHEIISFYLRSLKLYTEDWNLLMKESVNLFRSLIVWIPTLK